MPHKLRRCRECSSPAGPRTKFCCDYHAGYNAGRLSVLIRFHQTKAQIAAQIAAQAKTRCELKVRRDQIAQQEYNWRMQTIKAESLRRAEERRESQVSREARKAECFAEFMAKRQISAR